MNKAISSWHNTFRKLGLKRIKSKAQQVVRSAFSSIGSEREPIQFNVEVLEPRQMLSSVSLVEGEVSAYSTALTAFDANISDYQVLIDLGDGSSPFTHDDFTVTDGAESLVEINSVPILFHDDGEYEVTISLSGDGTVLAAETIDATVANVAPTVNVAGLTSNFAAGATYAIEFDATDAGDDTIAGWVVDWGDGVVEELEADASSALHVFVFEGQYDITVAAIDEDGQHAPTQIATQIGFGNAGHVSTAITGNFVVESSSQFEDGSFVVAGNQSIDDASSVVLVRYRADGALDLNFGEDGVSTISFGDDNTFEISSIARQSDEFLVAAGKIEIAGDVAFAMVRLYSDGSIDTSFGDANSPFEGLVVTQIGLGADTIHDTAIRGEQIVVVGSVETENGIADFAIAKYDLNGVLDGTFGVDGIVVTPFENNAQADDRATSVMLLDDHSILVVGQSAAPNAQVGNFGIAKYSQAGELDTTFGTNGIAVQDSFDPTFATDVVVTTDGKFIVAGRVEQTSDSNDGVLFQFNADGTLDSEFGDNGKFEFDFPSDATGSNEQLVQVQRQGDGKIVIASNASDSSYLTRLTSDGQLDASFGKNGHLPIAGFIEGTVASFEIGRDGGLIAIGYASSQSGDSDIVMSKLVSSNLVTITEELGSAETLFSLPAVVSNNIGQVLGNAESLSSGVWQPELDSDERQNDVALWRSQGASTSDPENWNSYEIDESLEEIDLGDSDHNILVDANTTGSGYIMYSHENIGTRFGISGSVSEHLIAVRYDGLDWQFTDGNTWTSFTLIGPASDNADFLVASVDFETSSVTSLEGQSAEVNGLKSGYIAGSMEITSADSGYSASAGNIWTGDSSHLGNLNEDGDPRLSFKYVHYVPLSGGFHLYLTESTTNREVRENVEGNLAEFTETYSTTAIVYTTDYEIVAAAVSANDFDPSGFSSFWKVESAHEFSYLPKSKINPLAIATSSYQIDMSFAWVGDRVSAGTNADGVTSSKTVTYNSSGSASMKGVSAVYGSRETNIDGTVEEKYIGYSVGTSTALMSSANSYGSSKSDQYGSSSSSSSDNYSLTSFDAYRIAGKGTGPTVEGATDEALPDETAALFAEISEEFEAGFSTHVSPEYSNGTSEITGTIWDDANENGLQENSESNLAGVGVTLWVDSDADGEADTVAGVAQTDEFGSYAFENLSSATIYLVGASAQLGGKLSSSSNTNDIDATTGLAAPITLGDGESYVVNASMRAVDTEYGYSNYGNELGWGTDSGESADSGDSNSTEQPTFSVMWNELGAHSFGWYQASGGSSFGSNYQYEEENAFDNTTVTATGGASGGSGFSSLGFHASAVGFNQNEDGGEDASVVAMNLGISNGNSNYNQSDEITLSNSGTGTDSRLTLTNSLSVTSNNVSSSTGNIMLSNSTSAEDEEGDLLGIIDSKSNLLNSTVTVTSEGNLDDRSVTTTTLNEGAGNGDQANSSPEFVANQAATDYLMGFVPNNFAEQDDVPDDSAGEDEDDNGSEFNPTPPNDENHSSSYFVLTSDSNSTTTSRSSGSTGLAINFLGSFSTDVQVNGDSSSTSNGSNASSSTIDSWGNSGDSESGSGSYYSDHNSISANNTWHSSDGGSVSLSSYSLNGTIERTTTEGVEEDDGLGDGSTTDGGESNYSTGDGLGGESGTGGYGGSTGFSGDNFPGGNSSDGGSEMGGSGSVFGGTDGLGGSEGGSGDSGQDTEGDGSESGNDERKEGVSGNMDSTSSFVLDTGEVITGNRTSSGGSRRIIDGLYDYDITTWETRRDFKEAETSTGASSTSSSATNLEPGKGDTTGDSTSNSGSIISGGGNYETSVSHVTSSTFIPDAERSQISEEVNSPLTSHTRTTNYERTTKGKLASNGNNSFGNVADRGISVVDKDIFPDTEDGESGDEEVPTGYTTTSGSIEAIQTGSSASDGSSSYGLSTTDPEYSMTYESSSYKTYENGGFLNTINNYSESLENGSSSAAVNDTVNTTSEFTETGLKTTSNGQIETNTTGTATQTNTAPIVNSLEFDDGEGVTSFKSTTIAPRDFEISYQTDVTETVNYEDVVTERNLYTNKVTNSGKLTTTVKTVGNEGYHQKYDLVDNWGKVEGEENSQGEFDHEVDNKQHTIEINADSGANNWDLEDKLIVDFSESGSTTTHEISGFRNTGVTVSTNGSYDRGGTGESLLNDDIWDEDQGQSGTFNSVGTKTSNGIRSGTIMVSLNADGELTDASGTHSVAVEYGGQASATETARASGRLENTETGEMFAVIEEDTDIQYSEEYGGGITSSKTANVVLDEDDKNQLQFDVTNTGGHDVFNGTKSWDRYRKVTVPDGEGGNTVEEKVDHFNNPYDYDRAFGFLGEPLPIEMILHTAADIGEEGGSGTGATGEGGENYSGPDEGEGGDDNQEDENSGQSSDAGSDSFEDLFAEGVRGLNHISISDMNAFVHNLRGIHVLNLPELVAFKADGLWYVFDKVDRVVKHSRINSEVTPAYWRFGEVMVGSTFKGMLQNAQYRKDTGQYNSQIFILETLLHLVPGGTFADKWAGGTDDSWGYVVLISVGDVLMVGGTLAKSGTKLAVGINRLSVLENGVGTILAGSSLYKDGSGAHTGDFLLRLVALGLGVKGSKFLQGHAPKGIKVGDYNLTKTVANHLDDVVKKAGPYQGKQARSFMNSPHLLDEIMAGGKAVPDRFVEGALRWDVPGSFRGSSGTWELVLDPKTKTILHWNFVR